MFFNLLTSESGAGTGGTSFPWGLVAILGFAVLWILYSSITGKKRREQMEAEREKRSRIEVGFKVTTIGGIVGTAVEVDNEAKTFVLQTGTEENPSFIKFDKVAIYSSEDPNAPVVTEEVCEDEVASDVFEEVETEEAQPLEEAPAVEDVPATEDAE